MCIFNKLAYELVKMMSEFLLQKIKLMMKNI